MVLGGLPALAQDATVQGREGEVEYQLRARNWQAANVGDIVPSAPSCPRLQSTASLSSMGSLITLKPLTACRWMSGQVDAGTKTA